MGRELRYNGGRDSIHILPVLVQSPINFLNKGTRIIQQILRGVDLADDLRNGFLRQLIYQVINRFVMRIKGCFVDLGALGIFSFFLPAAFPQPEGSCMSGLPSYYYAASFPANIHTTR